MLVADDDGLDGVVADEGGVDDGVAEALAEVDVLFVAAAAPVGGLNDPFAVAGGRAYEAVAEVATTGVADGGAVEGLNICGGQLARPGAFAHREARGQDPARERDVAGGADDDVELGGGALARGHLGVRQLGPAR